MVEDIVKDRQRMVVVMVVVMAHLRMVQHIVDVVEGEGDNRKKDRIVEEGD